MPCFCYILQQVITKELAVKRFQMSNMKILTTYKIQGDSAFDSCLTYDYD